MLRITLKKFWTDEVLYMEAFCSRFEPTVRKHLMDLAKHCSKDMDIILPKDYKGEGILIPYSKNNLSLLWTRLHPLAYIDYSVFKRVESSKTQEKSSATKLLSKREILPWQEIQIKKFVEHMQRRRYSQNTINTYSEALRTFLRFLPKRSLANIHLADLEEFNQHYILANGYSLSYQNQVINALKLYFTRFHSKKFDLNGLQRPRKEHKIPMVLSLEEIKQVLFKVTNIKHRTMLMCAYGCGLRSGEVLRLKLTDIHRERKLLRIEQSKGNKDRYVPLPDSLLAQIEVYYRAYSPKLYLFEGEKGGMYSATSLGKVFRKAVMNAEIQKNVTLHTLRHSYATHLLEKGVNLRYIQDILGHKSPKTTQIYTHVSKKALENIRSPLDDLNNNI